jgi:hypothetical protein
MESKIVKMNSFNLSLETQLNHSLMNLESK